MPETQISAYISDATKEEVERYAEAHGVKKGRLLEEALLHHLHALRELPADLLIPPRIDLSGDSFTRAVELAKKPRKPSRLLKDLMGGKNVDER